MIFTAPLAPPPRVKCYTPYNIKRAVLVYYIPCALHPAFRGFSIRQLYVLKNVSQFL